MKILPFLLISVGFAGSCLAQAPAKPVPYPGGVAIAPRAPERARWSITHNPSKTNEEEAAEAGNTKKAPGFSKKVMVIKDQPIVFERVLNPKGVVRDKWILNGFTFSKSPRDKKHVAYNTPNILGEDFYTDLSKTDFPGFEWVSQENYVDLKKVLNQDCLMYQLKGENDEVEVVAYVNYRSRFPVLLQKKEDVRVYQFENPPPTPLTLPPDVKEFLEVRAKTIKAHSK